jgi:hypothetical protein
MKKKCDETIEKLELMGYHEEAKYLNTLTAEEKKRISFVFSTDSLDGMFTWYVTPQGEEHWRAIDRHLQMGTSPLRDEPENSYRHFYLYAKGHYKKGDLLSDMKHLMAERCGLDEKHMRIGDIINCLTGEVTKVFLNNRHNDHLLERVIERLRPIHFLGASMDESDIPKGMSVTEFVDRRIINALLSEMMLTKVADIEGSLGIPSDDILPRANAVCI